jgi:predicted DNA-binding protein YlxM (UPF0122 family)
VDIEVRQQGVCIALRKVVDRMDYGPIQRLFGSNAITQIIDFMSTYREFDYSINEIAENTGVHRRSISRAIPQLEYYGVIVNVRKVDRANMYKMNKSSEMAVLICKLSKAVAEHDINMMMKAETNIVEAPEHRSKKEIATTLE